MKDEINKLKDMFLENLSTVKDLTMLNDLRTKYLGKKSKVVEFSSMMKDLTIEEKKEVGKLINDFKVEVENKLCSLKSEFDRKELEDKLNSEKIDVTLPATKIKVGCVHPITRIINEVEDLFISMGYDVLEGPEVESDLYNFEMLNLPKGHPARDTQDSFYITDDTLLRTQTSPVQVRTMRSQELPIKIISPGRCFRNDSLDATHSPMFHQIEGLVVGKDITMAQFKGTLELFVQKLFGSNTRTKFRPHNFPFTEPSAEIDVTCFKCGGEGCSMCKGEGWIEILGAGMVHPNVLRNCGIDPEVYSGFAFGMGVERLAMLKYEIDDIRLLVENDMRFLDQF